MKRITNYLIAMALMAFTFTSCEDVPNPFGQILPPGGGDEIETFTPEGSGTQADPFNVQGVLEYITSLGADVQSDKDVYIKGYVITIKEQYSAQYGNAQFTISDSKEGGNTFTFYRGLYLGNKKWVEGDATLNEGDEVIVCGKVVNYKGTTPETVQGAAYVYSINGKAEGGGGDTPSETIGTKDAPITVAKALEYINALADGGTTDKDAYVTGKITQIITAEDKIAQYKNIDYMISDGTNELKVFRGKNIDNTDFTEAGQISVGDEVVVLGKLMKYVKDSNIEPEVAQGNYIVKLTKGSGDGGTTSQYGTAESPLTVAQAMALIDAEGTVAEAFVKGKISQIDSYSSQYKSITYWISDDGGTTTQLQVYSGKGLNGVDFAAKEDLTVGQTVTVKGKLKKYNDIYEFDKTSSIVSIGDGGTTSQYGTAESPLTVAQAMALIDAEGTVAEAFVKGKISQIDSYSSQYKSITYWISDDGGTTTQLQVYSGKGLNGVDFAAKEDLTVGQTVTVKGKLKKYNDIYEFDKTSSIVSIGDGGTTSNYGTAESPLTVAQAMALIDAEGTVAEAFVKGKISQIDSYSSQYKSITYWISDDGGTTTQLEVYSGKGLNGADFAAKEDLTVGQTVTVKGKLKKYNDIYEFDKTSSIISIQ